MGASKLRKWHCPRCGNWRRAPSRPRRDDSRRYCLTCSGETGRLVERTCPSLEAERDRREEARKTAKVRRSEWERSRFEERHIVDGMDVREELARLCALPFVRSHGCPPIEMKVTWSRTKLYVTGHARPGTCRIHLGLYDGCPRHEAEALIAHELAHVILPGDVGHGERWRRTLARIVADGYGLTEVPAIATHGRSFDFDAMIEAQLRLRAGSDRVAHREAAAARRAN